MSKMTARILEHGDAAAYVALWEASAHRYLIQHPDYVRHAGNSERAVGVWANHALRLVVPFDIARSHGLSSWRSPLFTPFSGPLVAAQDFALTGVDADRFWRDALAALGSALGARADRIEMIFPPGISDARELGWNGWQLRPHFNYLSRWTAPGEWRQRMESSARRQERKALDAGLKFAALDAAQIEESNLPLLWRKNAGRQRLDAQLAVSLNRLGHWLAQRGQGFAARVLDAQGDTHAAALIGFDENRVYYLAGASDPSRLGSGAPTLLHTGIMNEIDGRGLPRAYDWVGANTPSVVRFKRGFSPELELLIAARWSSRKAKILDAAKALMRTGKNSDSQSIEKEK